MDKKLVSVIIPVKEENEYLKQVLFDLKHQSYPRVEVLVETGGGSASAARNIGLSKATGEYVIFADGDDRIEADYVSSLVDALESAPDIIMAGCGYDIVDPGTGGVEKTASCEPKIFLRDDMLSRLFDTKIYQGYVWNKIFKRELIDRYDLGFSEDIRYNEDRLFIFNYLLMNKGRVAYSNEAAYHYQLRADSVMGAIRNQDMVTDAMTTEFLAFSMMRVQLEMALLPGLSGDRQLIDPVRAGQILSELRQDEIQSQLRLFKKMVGPKDIFRYRKSPMRKFAKECPVGLYIPRAPMEDVLLKIYKRYALTGCTYTSHPEYFEGVGYLG